METAPEYPAGPFEAGSANTLESRQRAIMAISRLPGELRSLVENLSEDQLETKYRNWTVRQIVHHLADSHINSYVRFKWALTEDSPTIKAYDESLWSALEESRTGSIAPSLALLDGLHARWNQLLTGMTDDQFQRSFHHPETDSNVVLADAVQYYAWHGKHHLSQIRWLIDRQLS